MKKILPILFAILAIYYLTLLVRNFIFVAENQIEYNYGVITGRIILFVFFCLAAYFTNRDFWKSLFSRK